MRLSQLLECKVGSVVAVVALLIFSLALSKVSQDRQDGPEENSSANGLEPVRSSVAQQQVQFIAASHSTNVADHISLLRLPTPLFKLGARLIAGLIGSMWFWPS